MPNTEALVLQMSADITRMTKALNAARGQADRQLKGIEDRFSKMNNNIRRSQSDMARDLRSSVAAIGAAFAVRDIANAADQWTNLRNQVRGYAAVVGPVGEATNRLLKVANDAGVSIGALGTTFAASARAAKTLGASADQVFAFNEAVAKGGAIANTGAAALEGALTQLGQAIGSPKVQLGEFNSVIEGTPRLAQAFADGVKEAGGSVAKLRELIADGEISGSELFQGLLSQLPLLRSEFAESESTITRSMNRLGNSFIQYVGNADRALGATQLLSGFISTVADNFDQLADAAIVAAGFIGGALAVGAMGRAIGALREMIKDARTAQSAMGKLGLAFTFFTGPVGASIIGIGAALAALAIDANKSSVSVDSVNQSLAELQQTQDTIKAKTGELQTAQEALNRAIETQGVVAQNAARKHVQEIERQIEAENKLLAQKRLALKNDLENLRRQNDPKRGGLSANLNRALGTETPIGEKRGYMERDIERLLGPQQYGESYDQWIDRARDHLNGLNGRFTDLELDISNTLTEVDAFDLAMKDLAQRISEIDLALPPAQQLQLDKDLGQFNALRSGGAGDASSAASGTKAYQTDLEALGAVLDGLRESAKADEEAFSGAAQALDHLSSIRERFAKYGAYLSTDGSEDPNGLAISANDLAAINANSAEQDAAKFKEIIDRIAKNAAERSRIAADALLAYAKGGQLADAFAQLPRDILVGEDESTVVSELTAMAQAAADAVATGLDAVEAEFRTKWQAINDAESAAMAAGLANLEQFVTARQELLNETQKKREDADPLKVDNIYDSLDYTALSDPTGYLPDFVAAGEEFRQIMQDSVKNALREGIRTGDWDDAFRSVLADAVTSGLDSALNRVGDWLADFLFAENGFLSNIINGAMSWGASSFGGFRAAGGPVMAGKSYVVGENGPELLRMGAQSGQILNASQLNGMKMGRPSGPTTIAYNLNVAGSIDSVTWPKIEQAMRSQTRQIMTAMPGLVNATITDNRIQKRRL